jgi:Ser/Thr protein kinase RdoA (MazF antagonist)
VSHPISVAHSIFDGNALCAELCASFDIGAIDECRLWRSFINDVYRVGMHGRYVWLRIHPAGWRTEAETAAELAAILAIGKAGGSVARPIPRSDGTFMLRLPAPEGPRVAVLFEHAAGEDLIYTGADGPDNARRYGTAVARLHNACDAVAEKPDSRTFALHSVINGPLQTLERFLSAADITYMCELARRLTAKIQTAGQLEIGFCHGDLNCANIHFTDDTAVAFDFDCCAWGWRAFERAAFARGVTWHLHPGDVADALMRNYVTGYRSIRSIAEADLRVQPAMLIAQRMWVTALHLEGAGRFGAMHFDRPYAARFVTWAKAWEPRLDAQLHH